EAISAEASSVSRTSSVSSTASSSNKRGVDQSSFDGTSSASNRSKRVRSEVRRQSVDNEVDCAQDDFPSAMAFPQSSSGFGVPTHSLEDGKFGLVQRSDSEQEALRRQVALRYLVGGDVFSSVFHCSRGSWEPEAGVA